MAKRTRAAVACARCKLAKQKCSDFRPCKQCNDSRYLCSVAPSKVEFKQADDCTALGYLYQPQSGNTSRRIESNVLHNFSIVQSNMPAQSWNFSRAPAHTSIASLSPSLNRTQDIVHGAKPSCNNPSTQILSTFANNANDVWLPQAVGAVLSGPLMPNMIFPTPPSDALSMRLLATVCGGMNFYISSSIHRP